MLALLEKPLAFADSNLTMVERLPQKRMMNNMEQETLRRLQLTQLEIAKEIKRVCQENGISFFLSNGTLLGAVRHQGFIPWDDDMDLGMLRPDYDRFCKIAPEKLKPEFYFQSWDNEPGYAMPFGKVMKRGTTFISYKTSRRLAENGIYVDIFPYDNAPLDETQRSAFNKTLRKLYRIKLMCCGNKPWMERKQIIWKKRIGYLYYQAMAMFADNGELSRRFDRVARSQPVTGLVVKQESPSRPVFFQRAWLEELQEYCFEDTSFPGPKNYDSVLTAMYGSYMELPPESERGDRHQVMELDFGDEG